MYHPPTEYYIEILKQKCDHFDTFLKAGIQVGICILRLMMRKLNDLFFVYVICMCSYVHAHANRGLKLKLDVFLSCFSPYFLR